MFDALTKYCCRRCFVKGKGVPKNIVDTQKIFTKKYWKIQQRNHLWKEGKQGLEENIVCFHFRQFFSSVYQSYI